MSCSMAGSGAPKAEMNVTPMIDILLVLIIVFMVVVVSTFHAKGLQTQIPQPATDDTPSRVNTIVIQLAWAGDDQPPSVKINEGEVTWDQLHDRLFAIFRPRAERVAFVKGDDDVDFLYVAEAIDIARGSGVDRIGLLSKTGSRVAVN